MEASDGDTNGPVPPVAWEVLSGPEAILTRALLWCGWEVRHPIDCVFSERMDIRGAGLRSKLREGLQSVGLWWIGVECSSMCRPREISLPFPNAPGPLRSMSRPDGLPSLTGRDRQRVVNDNENADFLLNLAADADFSGATAVLENPRSAYLWAAALE